MELIILMKIKLEFYSSVIVSLRAGIRFSKYKNVSCLITQMNT